MYVEGTWGTVCDDSWDRLDAGVVCRQLGFNTVIETYSEAYFGEGNGEILFDDLDCNGDEDSLMSCSHSGLGIHGCGHHEDAGVSCGNECECNYDP